MDPNIPYNELPPLPPKASLETKTILKKGMEAHRHLAELKGVGPLIPNQRILVQSIVLQEAKMSSEVENIVTTNDELYRSFSDHGKHTDPHTKEVLCYNDALWYGYDALKEKNRLLTTPLYEELVQILVDNQSGVRKIPGTHIRNTAENRVVYTPPVGERVIRDKLANLENFIYNNKELDPLIKLCLIHYQFEAIHPFNDGNGRTGRILNILYLVLEGLLDIPVLYLSHYIIENKSRYYELLRKVTEEGDWESWTLYMLDAVSKTSQLTTRKILAIVDLMGKTAQTVKEKLPKIYSKDLIEVLFEYPYCKIRFFEERGIAKRQTAALYLQELERVGVLKSVKRGREKYFINVAFLDLLSD